MQEKELQENVTTLVVSLHTIIITIIRLQFTFYLNLFILSGKSVLSNGVSCQP